MADAKCAPPGCVSSVALDPGYTLSATVNTPSSQAVVVQAGTPEIAKLKYNDIHEEHEFMSELHLDTEEKEGSEEKEGESASM